MNKVVLIGRLAKDAELKILAEGKAVAKTAMAVKRAFKKDEADFINIVAFNRTAEILAEYTSKGKEIAISGEIRTGSYKTQEGETRYTTEVIVNDLKLLGNVTGEPQRGADTFGGLEPISDGEMPW